MMSSEECDTSSSASSNSSCQESQCQYAELKNRYTLVKTIGKGNFAYVKSAIHNETNYNVAIKIINNKKLNKVSSIKLEREIDIMKKIDHRNIVKLIEIIRGEKYTYLVLELVNGGELFDFLLNGGKMKEKDAKKTFYQLVQAVMYCHAKNVVHRDLKAENVLLDEYNNVKLADFGFANYYNPDSYLETCCGSPPYAAPELFQAKKYRGPEVDVWSLGVILYTLVTGSLPFNGSDISKMRESVLSGKFKVPFYVSNDCENLLRQMLCKDVSKRIKLDQVVQSEWLANSKNHKISTRSNDRVKRSKFDDDLENFKSLVEKFDGNANEAEKSIMNDKFDRYHAFFIILHHFNQFSQFTIYSQHQTIETNNNTNNKYNEPQESSPTLSRIKSSKVTPKRVLEKRNLSKPLRINSVNNKPSVNQAIPVEEDLSKVPKIVLQKSFHSSKFDADQNFEFEKRSQAHRRLKELTKRLNISLANTVNNNHHRGDGGVENYDSNNSNNNQQQIQKQANNSISDKDAKQLKPRSVLIAFNVKKLRVTNPEEILIKLKESLTRFGINFLHISKFCLNCVIAQPNKKNLVFEIEILKLKSTKKPYGLKAKRLHGSAINYKILLENIYTIFDSV